MNLDINKFMKILSGDTLLEKVKELEGAPLSRVLTECGYTFRGKNNCEQFNYLYFYEQLFRATGIINKDTTLTSIDDLSKVVSSKEFVEKTPKVWDKAKEPKYNFSGFFEEIVGGKEKNNDLEIWREQNLYPFFGGKLKFWKKVLDCLIGLTKEEKREAINIFQSKTRIGILVSYLKLIHIFEEKNNLKKTEINDPVISNIISNGRHIHAVISKNLKDPDPKICDYCYSTGNFILNKKVPEIITFFPSVNTNAYLINLISDYIINGKIILDKKKIQQIYGLIGEHGDFPIRIKLLEDNEIEELNQKYTYFHAPSTPTLLIDVPDFDGKFAHESNDLGLTKNVPENFRLNTFSTKKYFPFTNLPISKDAFSIAIESSMRFLELDTETDQYRIENNPEKLTESSRRIIWEIIDLTNPDNYVNDIEFWQKVFSIKKIASNPLICEVFFKNKIINEQNILSKDEFNKKWLICEFNYKSLDKFISDISWTNISSIIINSWKDSYSEKDMINHRFNQKLCENCLLGIMHDEKLDKLHEEVKKINRED